MTPLNLRKENRGFTLIELLVAMALGLVVLGAVLRVFVSQNRTNAAQQEVAYAQQNVRAGLELMARDVRNAGSDPENGGFVVIPQATGTTLQVRADYSNPADGDATDANEDVTYTIDNGNRRLTRDGFRMIDNVVPNSLQFAYYMGGTNTPFVPATQADRDAIRAVGIQFQVHTESEDPAHAGGYNLFPASGGTCRVRTLATRVRVRNMGFQDIE
jgi:prepilin-type N-terminal cleavage/methylation domain-containing protein